MWRECRKLGRALPGNRKVEGIRTKLSASRQLPVARSLRKSKICSVVLQKGVSFLVAANID